MSHLPKSLRQLVLWMTFAAVVVGGLGCESGCGHTAPPQGFDGAHRLAEAVPPDAEVVVYSRRLDTLVDRIDAVFEGIPVSPDGPGELENWKQLGAAEEAPAVAFWRGGQWGVVAWVDHERGASMETWETAHTRQQTEPGEWWEWSSEGWREVDDEGTWTRWGSTDGRRVAVGWSLSGSVQPLGERLFESEKAHFETPPLERWADPGDDGGPPELVGVVDGGGLTGLFTANSPGDSSIPERTAESLGTVHFAIRSGDAEARWTVELDAPGAEEADGLFGDLGEARGDVPPLGGLVEADTPAVFRLSGMPRQFVEFAGEQLGGQSGELLDTWTAFLRDELSIDLQADVYENLTGQAVVIVFDFKAPFFETGGLEWFARLGRLETTREALVIPFEDRDAIVQVLDAFTQISRGEFRREGGSDTVRYVRLDNGELKWLLLVGEQRMVMVDSIAANDQVRRWQRDPDPMDGLFAERGVDRVIDARTGMGAYLDIAQIRSGFAERDRSGVVRWLEPLEAMRVQTDIDGHPQRSEIAVWLEQPNGDAQ